MQKLTRISDTAYYSSRFGFDVIQALAWVCCFQRNGLYCCLQFVSNRKEFD